MNWNNVKSLNPPLKTTGDDVILSGHGAYKSNGNTTVPAGVELWIMAPPAASITDGLGQALEGMSTINKLGIISKATNSVITTTPNIYKAGQSAPNYILQAPNGITLKPGGPHLIGVTQDTPLSDLWARVAPFVKPGKTIRVFWAACTAMSKAENQIVDYQ